MRRTFLGGILSLIAIVVLFFTGFQGITYPYSEMVGKVFVVFCLASIPLGLIFWIISAFYIRKKGQFSGVHQQQSFLTTLFRMLGHDITFPFRQIPALFVSNKTAVKNYSQVFDTQVATAMAEGSKAIARSRILSFIIRLGICLIGIASSMGVVSQYL